VRLLQPVSRTCCPNVKNMIRAPVEVIRTYPDVEVDHCSGWEPITFGGLRQLRTSIVRSGNQSPSTPAGSTSMSPNSFTGFTRVRMSGHKSGLIPICLERH